MRASWLVILLLLGMGLRGAERTIAAPRPNVVFILADDLGWTDTGAYGSRYYETPHIDQLAAQGMKLQRYYHCQNCQPTRAALLSGQYAPRTGIYTVGDIYRFAWRTRPLKPVENVTALPLEIHTIADQLQAAGYATGMFGKWHLGNGGKYHPSQRGFEEAIQSEGKHFDFQTQPKTEVPDGAYLADFLTDRAEEFIRRHQEQPFFLYLPHFGVHSPYQAKPALIEKFAAKSGQGGHRDPTYAAMIASVDESVGRITRLLDELQLADNTVVIFSSDNGGVGGYQREGIEARDVTDNSPLRAGKGSLYEGGIRVPFIVRWPGVTTPGSTCDEPATHVDFFPTMLQITGAAAPDKQPLDGESLVPLFRDPQAELTRTAIYQHFPGYLGSGNNTWRTTPVGVIITDEWKLMEFFEDNRLELYQLTKDVGEQRNVAAMHPEKTRELHQQLVAWREEIGAKMPTPHEPEAAPAASGKKKGKGKKKR